VDVIVGFPCETEERFLETYDFLNSLDISYLHVFTYSERDNTEAAEMAEVVPMETRNQRNKMLRILSAKKRRAFYESQLGYQGTVLVEAEQKKGRMYGFTENYVKVSLPYNENRVNTLHPIRLESIDHESHARGTILSNETIAAL
jgi:threonylcarbamoyladenosine tRNA methylthiotransferase MtaB